MSHDEKVRVGISVGDINGIGPEVILKTLNDNRILELCVPIVYGSTRLMNFYKRALNMPDINFNVVDDAEKATARKPNLMPVWEEEVQIDFGKSNSTGGKYALLSLEAAVKDLAANKTDVLVTAPINKENIQAPNFKFPGHTEYLASYANEENYIMLMVHDTLRVGLVTGHVSVKEISEKITVDAILKKLTVLNKTLLQDFAIRKPRIAVLGLNPHAGDKGLLGEEEQQIISPAIQKANEQGVLAFGPFPADGFFGSSNIKKYDAVLAMYHDQGLAPFKALSFDEGVNFTAGLPIVRTAPDHGTAYDIAGQNIASENSFRNAIYAAIDVYRSRINHREISANPLKFTQLSKE